MSMSCLMLVSLSMLHKHRLPTSKYLLTSFLQFTWVLRFIVQVINSFKPRLQWQLCHELTILDIVNNRSQIYLMQTQLQLWRHQQPWYCDSYSSCGPFFINSSQFNMKCDLWTFSCFTIDCSAFFCSMKSYLCFLTLLQTSWSDIKLIKNCKTK